MKRFIIIVCLAFVAYAAKDLNALLERADELEGRTQKIVNEYKNHSKSHLLNEVEFELKNLQRIQERLRKLVAKNASERRTHEENEVEEELLHVENRLNEELSFVEDVFNNQKNSTGKQVDELVQYAEKLNEEVKQIIAKHETHNHRDLEALRREQRELEDLVADLRRHPKGGRAEREEELVERIEKSLRALIERIEAGEHNEHEH